MRSSTRLLALLLPLLLCNTTAFCPQYTHVAFSPLKTLRKSRTDVGAQLPPSCTHLYASSSNDDVDEQQEEEEEEWFPVDPAETTPQLLAALWSMIAQGSSMIKGESTTVRFPEIKSQFSPSYLNRLMGHLDSCKDVCDYFGTKTVLVPYTVNNELEGFTVKSYRNPNDKDDEYEFDYDPFWDDGDDWDYEGVDAEVEGRDASREAEEIANRIPDDDEEIIQTTKVWVDKMMSDMGICPFTSGPDLAGLPMGPVYYTLDRSTQMEDLYARYWKEVVRVEQQPEKDLSTTLLIAPEFCIDNIELFESFSNTLTQPLTALGIEDLLQLVFFHPQWTFRDGSARAGIGNAANYARRSPWPMINILRTSQVRAAQKGIPTGLVYQQNEKTLDKIGAESLEKMLRHRDWSDIEEVKVNRRDMEALRVAQDFQQTGSLKSEDTSFAYDSTPAANKVDRSQIEGGNMVNVISQALSKRLGKNDGGDGVPTALSGPETSATVMASDFLLEELDRIAASGIEEVVEADEEDKRMSEARKLILQDLAGDDEAAERDEMDVMFGQKGIPMKKNGDDEGGAGSAGGGSSRFGRVR